jgi:hypothetical protein
MNSPVILEIIASYLDAKTLVIFSQCSRLHFKITQNDSFWESLYSARYWDSLEIYGYSPHSEKVCGKDPIKPVHRFWQFKQLYKLAVIKNQQWSSLKSFIFTENDTETIAFETGEILRSPGLPILALRREGKTFATILQDIMGNVFSEPPMNGFQMPSPLEQVMQMIFMQEETLLEEYSEKEYLAFMKCRWIIKKPSTLKSDNQKSSMFLLHLAKTLKGVVSVNCKSTMTKLSSLKELSDFLSEYYLRVFST